VSNLEPDQLRMEVNRLRDDNKRLAKRWKADTDQLRASLLRRETWWHEEGVSLFAELVDACDLGLSYVRAAEGNMEEAPSKVTADRKQIETALDRAREAGMPLPSSVVPPSANRADGDPEV
jgi:hypothetical protein